ncbi:hypothetical protein Patl1_13984 [Pistacia atlantica]|uniref:Uncharacterized protein n=1 Tax=Pistacia atlantica TaxID=434234 RepID=A0ACC1ATE0_9ROSI|nr:hypothetical protein Patl1_13984 [Pistacia atlantica]
MLRAKSHIAHTIRQLTTTIEPTQLPISAIQNKIKYLESKQLYDQILQFYKHQLHLTGLHANTFILPSVIKACSHSHFHLHFGLQLHCLAFKSGSDSDQVTSNSLITMYAKYSKIESAYLVFDKMPHREIISWNSIINCFTQSGYYTLSLKMLKQMYLCGFVPKPELIAGVLSLGAQSRDLTVGRQLHALVIIHGLIEESVFLSTALLDLYSKCGELMTALRVFDQAEIKNEVSWTAMISGCIDNQNYDMGIDCFRAMQIEGVKPNRVTLLVALLTCTELDFIEYGKAIHGYAYRHGFDWNHRLSSALMHMYCECAEALHPARIIFERSEVKDVVMWSSIIAGYSRIGDCDEAMKLFRRMRVEGHEPNSVTLLAMISACTSLSSLSHGLGIHCYISKTALHSDVFIGNALINMYSKCGSLEASHLIFNEMACKDCVSWSTLINSYGLHGCGEEALQLLHKMLERGIEPDAITLLSILSACNHWKSGKIKDACEVVRTMPMKPSTKLLSSLVSACKIHGRLVVAEMLAHQLIESEPENAANYTLLSMIYAECCNWVGVEEVRSVMRVKGLNKCYGFSRID